MPPQRISKKRQKALDYRNGKIRHSDPISIQTGNQNGNPDSDPISIQTGNRSLSSRQKSTSKEKRFILFIGNLSYKITTEILSSHFSSVGTLLSVRLPYTQTSAPRPKGYAFIEYKDSLSLAKALKLHHTVLHDRKINVELTGGGGGNSIARKSKLKIKNSRLNMQRKKRIQSENVPEMIHPSRISRVKM